MGQQEIFDVLRANKGVKFTSSEILAKVNKVCNISSVSASLRKLRKGKFVKYGERKKRTKQGMRQLYIYWVD